MLHQIGVGALGPVFRTYEPIRDRLVAVKVFRLDVIPEQARALADELGRAAKAGLFHPSIVEPLAAGVEGTVAYRAEEYVAAESLDVAMRHYAPATLEKAMPFVTQLASAIDFARAAGVGHGALHPRDIFVTPDEARATGFGVVDALDRLGLRAPVRRPYSPPERIAGAHWSTQADVFSLAVITFELLTGRRPAGLGAAMGPLNGAAIDEQSDEIRTVLARAMHAEPSERFASARAFSAALAQAGRLAETAVSLSTFGDGMPLGPDLGLRIVPGPAAPVGDLPLATSPSALPPASDILIRPTSPLDATAPADDHVLDEFASEPDGPSQSESPRELARKVIAARDVRKRHVRKKTEKGADDPLSEAAADEAPDSHLAPSAVAGDLFGAAGVVAPVDASSSPLDSGSSSKLDNGSHSELDSGSTSKDSGSTSKNDERADLALGAAPVAHDVKGPVAAEAENAALEAIDLDLALGVPAVADRVVDVDAFKSRDVTLAKSDHLWPRAPDRAESGRPEPARMESERRPDRAAMPRLGVTESADSETPPPLLDAPVGDRQRPVMLERALVLSLGLVLGYALCYVRLTREQPVVPATTAAAPVATESRTPGTSGRTPVKDATEQLVPQAPAAAAPSDTSTPAAAATTPTPAPRAREVRPPAATGRIVVSSTPARAGVTLNDKWIGRTPLTIDDLAFGRYAVRVVEPGYEVAREPVTLSASTSTRTLDVTLRRDAASKRTPAAEARAPQTQNPAPPAKSPAPVTGVGGIFVDSRPRGARVFVDGAELGVTPLQLTGQPVGSRVVRLELADHQSWTATTQVVAEKTSRVTGSLERIR